MKRMLDCRSSDLLNASREELLYAIAHAEGRTIACETIGSIMPMLGDVTRGVWDMRFWFDVHCPDGPCGLYDVSWCTMR